MKRASVFCKVLLHRKAINELFCDDKAVDSLVIGSPERYVLLHSHNLDMVEILCRTPNDALHWVDFTLLNNPTLCL